jgi:tRNA threonylcarbamoyladenosine modification (KEOPS) complex  Pcc1 subunit
MELEALEGIIKIKAKKELIEALKIALNEYKEERFSTNIKSKDAILKITVKASDATALRAGLNSYLRILQSINAIGDKYGK